MLLKQVSTEKILKKFLFAQSASKISKKKIIRVFSLLREGRKTLDFFSEMKVLNLGLVLEVNVYF